MPLQGFAFALIPRRSSDCFNRSTWPGLFQMNFKTEL